MVIKTRASLEIPEYICSGSAVFRNICQNRQHAVVMQRVGEINKKKYVNKYVDHGYDINYNYSY